jgi:hypothetical protein
LVTNHSRDSAESRLQQISRPKAITIKYTLTLICDLPFGIF